jgi:hypothetical protein
LPNTLPTIGAATVAAGDGREDIEVLEWPLEKALQAIREGEIVDAKTIMLLQHLALNRSTLG